MQAMFDSRTNKLKRVGDHDGTPRFWTVTNHLLYADGEKQKMTFRSKTKMQITALAELIDNNIREEIAVRGVAIIHHHWIAIAR